MKRIRLRGLRDAFTGKVYADHQVVGAELVAATGTRVLTPDDVRPRGEARAEPTPLRFDRDRYRRDCEGAVRDAYRAWADDRTNPNAAAALAEEADRLARVLRTVYPTAAVPAYVE